MTQQSIDKQSLFSTLPKEWGDDVFPEIRACVHASGRKLVVIDDDPLGTQTVHDLPILTDWSVNMLADELAGEYPAFYVLTNSRSMTPSEASRVNAEVGSNLREAAARTGIEFDVVSRSDSTLRGHFPGEVDALVSALGQEFDACILIPFFPEGGRYTVNDIHYVAEGATLVPAGETEFARDSAFGYRESNLRRWVEEKTGGRVPFASVASISIDDIRLGGPERVAQWLMALSGGTVCVVNSASMRDMEVFVSGLLDAEARGKRFVFRTAASFIKARLGMEDRPLLTCGDLHIEGSGGGLIIVGSHVPRTTSQLGCLLSQPGPECLEIDVEALLDDRREGEIGRVSKHIEGALASGRDAVVYTSRDVLKGDCAESSLAISNRVSDGLVSLVQAVLVRPRYILAKGGITASDIATRGLGVRYALVLGQILPGVPVWRLGSESRHPGLTYIVFPGNVGGPEALAEVVRKLEVNIGLTTGRESL